MCLCLIPGQPPQTKLDQTYRDCCVDAVNNLTNISENDLRGTFRVSFSVMQLCFSASASPIQSTT